MDAFLPSLISIAILLVLGAWLDVVFCCVTARSEKQVNSRSIVSAIPIWFTLGITLYTVVFTLLGIMGVMVTQTLVALLLAVCAAMAFVIFRVFGNIQKQYYYLGSFDWLCVAAIFIPCIMLACMRLATPSLEVDLFNHLLSKAKFLMEEPISTMTFVHDNVFATAHPKYPPLFAFLFNLPFLVAGKPIEASFYLLNGWMLLCVGLLVYSVIEEIGGKLLGLAAALIAISSRAVFGTLFFDNADLLMSFFLLAATASVVLVLKSDNQRQWLVTFCVLAGAALSKSEGLLAVAILAVCATAFRLSDSSFGSPRDRGRSLLWPMFLLTISVAPWWVYQISLRNPVEPLFIDPISASLPNAPKVITHFLTKMILPDWNFVFWAFLVCLITICFQMKSVSMLILFLMPILMLSAYCIVLCIGQGHEISTTPWGPNVIYRAIGQTYPLAVLAIFYSLVWNMKTSKLQSVPE